jgi:predicted enzyme related to lactoylglutathione lyase
MATPINPEGDSMQATTPIDWFEIPVHDIDRAQAFYEKLLGAAMRRETIAGNTLAVFDGSGGAVGGCLMAGDAAPPPSESGTLIDLHAGASLDAVLARLEAAGGRLATPRVQLPGDMGCYAHIRDTEGNRVGLHATR